MKGLFHILLNRRDLVIQIFEYFCEKFNVLLNVNITLDDMFNDVLMARL